MTPETVPRTPVEGYSDEIIKQWLNRIIGSEGVLSTDRLDRGNWKSGRVGDGDFGGSKYGISAMSYPDIDIKNLSLSGAVEIYQRDFVRPLKLGRYQDGVAFQLLDFAVNSGGPTARKRIQKAIGVKPDGDIGPVTLGTLDSMSESDIIMLVIAERIDYIRTRSRAMWDSQGNGLMGRMANNLRYGAIDS